MKGGGRSWVLESPRSVRSGFLWAAGAVELLLLALLAWWPGAGMPWPGLVLFFGAYGAYGLAAFVRASNREAGSVAGIWVMAVLFRLALLAATPVLSDDVFRYLWDGHVQLQGINPYLYAPSDPALAGIRTAWHARINHPDVPTIYPPLAQVAFLLVALAGDGILQAKVLWVALDLAAAWVLGRVARAGGRDERTVLLLYLWCPLLVVETAWSAHLEPLGLLALALILFFRRRPWRAGAAGAAAALTKFAPVAALPPLLRKYGWRFGLAFLAGAALLYVPYLDAGSHLWTGLYTYARDWRFMVGPFGLVESVVPGRWASRAVAGAIVVGAVGWTTFRAYEPERALFWIIGAGLLFSPTVQPWYLLWILPFAALRRSGPWILLCGLVFLGYWGLGAFQETGVWPQPLWLRLLVWCPPLAWMAVASLRNVVGHGAAAALPGVGAQAGVSQGEPARPEEE